jgi:hypothetical protein
MKESGKKKGKGASPSVLKRKTDDRVEVRNVNVPGYTARVDAVKYGAIKTALLRALPKKTPGLTQAEMLEALLPHLPARQFPGGAKAGWWTKTVQLDLEAKGVLKREPTKPLRWHRAWGSLTHEVRTR